MKINKILTRIIAKDVRNELENLHSGITPCSKKGDNSDIKVITPYGEIPWKNLSRINNKEMRELMLNIEDVIYKVLEYWNFLKTNDKENFEKIFIKSWEKDFFHKYGVSWDLPKKLIKKNE